MNTDTATDKPPHPAAVGAQVQRGVGRGGDARTLETHSEISDAVRGMERERHAAMRQLMRDFDHGYYYPGLKEMREACGRLGHKWRFTHLGPLSDPWFSCGVCHATEFRPER